MEPFGMHVVFYTRDTLTVVCMKALSDLQSARGTQCSSDIDWSMELTPKQESYYST